MISIGIGLLMFPTIFDMLTMSFVVKTLAFHSTAQTFSILVGSQVFRFHILLRSIV